MNTYNAISRFTVLKTLVLGMFVLIMACARQGSPTGGPKDVAPPVPLRSKPVNYSTNFNSEKIIIEFDEFVQLKNITQELLISPPLPEKPAIKLRGKGIVIKLNNTLKDSTTYNINFYDAIVDLNENNPLPNFQFEMSTGPVFDSVYLGGTVMDAFNYKTEKALKVMLYSDFNDTLPRTSLPDFVAKTDAKGNYMISNLKNKPYYIFALRDMNNNMKFDLPNESIAFIDTALSAGFKKVMFTDTLKIIDKISANYKDTVWRDSLHVHQEWVTTLGDIRLFMFTEENNIQYFKQALRPEKEQIIFAFNAEVDSAFGLEPLNVSTTVNNWYVQEHGLKNDSLIFWLTDTALINRDTLLMALHYTMRDSMQNPFIKTDTLPLVFKPKEVKPSKSDKKAKKGGGLMNLFTEDKKKEETAKIDSIKPSELTFKSNATTPFDLGRDVSLEARFPIAKTNIENIKMVFLDDTIRKPVKFKFETLPNSLQSFRLTFDMDEDQTFELLMLPGAFTDIYGNINDTLKYSLKTRTLDYYSVITLKIVDVLEPSMVQMMDSKENLIKETFITADTTITFKHLEPQQYIFKLFYDSNGNKKWDTGNFKALLQPEQVFYFPEEVKTKSNFDYEYQWDLYKRE